MNYPMLKYALIASCISIASGCSLPGDKRPVVSATASPVNVEGEEHSPSRTITGFTQSLQCMNRLLVDYDIPVSSFAVVQSEDGGAEVSGLYDMLLVALSTISGRNRRLAIVSGSNSFHEIHQNPDYADPEYFIRIGSPQVDTAVVVSRTSAGFDLLPLFSNRSGESRTLSTISVALTMGGVSDLQLVPGVFSNNRIVISDQHTNTSLSANVSLQSNGLDDGGVYGLDSFGGEDFGGEEFGSEDLSFENELGASGSSSLLDSFITALGASLKVNISRKNGLHQAVRTLVELGAIEIVGKHTKTPYWECLDIPATSPQVRPILNDWYESMTDEERVSYVQKQLGTIDEELDVNGRVDPESAAAIARYQSANGLLANGRIDFEIYYHLVTQKNPESLQSEILRKPPNKDVQPVEIFPVSGTAESYRENEIVRLKFRSRASRYVYCYFEQAGGQLFQLFPNTNQPSALVKANRNYWLTSDTVNIVSDAADSIEKVFCYAHDVKVAQSGNYSSLSYSSLKATAEELNDWHYSSVHSRPFYQEYKILIR